MGLPLNLYSPAFLGECSKHKGHGWLGCPLCAIEDVERRRKELSKMLNENDFDIDSFIDYKPNFLTMQKQIKFDASLIGKPGITVKIDGEVPKYIEYFPKRDSYFTVALVDINGKANNYGPDYSLFSMYRQQRSAEDIAKEVLIDFQDNGWSKWENYTDDYKKVLTALVQAGMDEMKGGEE